MALRPVFFVDNNVVRKESVEFEWFPGFSLAQKQRCVKSLHQSVRRRFSGARLLEVSTKSQDDLGKKLSAFNLKLDGVYLENVFQASKVFERGGPFSDLLTVMPKDAKRDPRLRGSGNIVTFRYKDHDWPLTPHTVFYDYLYYLAVQETLSKEELDEFRQYSFFTDIEFNPEKSLNTQARSAGIIRLILEQYKQLIEIKELDQFIKFHKAFVLG